MIRMISSNWGIVLFIVSCCLFASNFLNTFASPTPHPCLPDQKDALLDFKNEFRIQKRNGFPSLYNPKTESWKNNDDCCYWDGVTCDAESGEVIGLDLSFNCLTGVFKPNSSLFRLQHLRSLNLALNNFSSSSIPAEFSKLTKLSQLELFYSSFSGQIPAELLQLTKLVSLDLSTSPFYPDLFIEGPFLSKLARNLTNLRKLNLSSINISSTIPKNFVNLSSLRSLNLDGCNLFGEFPRDVFLLPQIQSISLSNNANLKVSLPEFLANSSLETLDLSNTTSSDDFLDSIGNLKSLNVLKLKRCNITGRIPFSLGNLSHLTSLDLSYNKFVGAVPSSIGNLKLLTDLTLSDNELDGNFPLVLLNLSKLAIIDLSFNRFAGPFPSNMRSLSKLKAINVYGNSFVGTFPVSLFAIPSLTMVALGENQFGGPLKFGNIPSSSKLEDLLLGDNNFNGPIPRSVSKLVNLMGLSLSNLNMSGTVDLSIFSHLKSLDLLDLSGNSVSVTNVNSTSDFPSQLSILLLSGCNISEFPEFLRTQRDLQDLDISNNRIKGQIPDWLWRLPQLERLNLSHNSFSVFEGSPVILPGDQMSILDLRSNAFGGQFPVPPLSTKYLFASENNFTGKIPQSICRSSSLEILDLSNNKFTGSIPRCFGNFSSSLSVLNFRSNNLTGSLPEMFICGHNLRTIDVGHNRLEREFPKSLINCTGLEVLNVESNRINDIFPFYLEALPVLQVLILRCNEFHGPIHLPRISFGFPRLRIIDISRNDFIGTLPSNYFVNWGAMSSIKTNEDYSKLKYMGNSWYRDSLVLMDKGVEITFVKILTIYTAIDFSGNRFQGQIPESVGLLKELKLLNLSNNAFIDHIPSSLATLTELESLDLSQNKLSGKIPPELGNLSSLAHINFSHNQLTGPIPQGTQFQTQNSSSFKGNLRLCGRPLEKSCGDINTRTSLQSQQSEPEEEVLSWIVVAIGFVPGLVFGLTIGHIVSSYQDERFTKIFGRNKQRRTGTC